MSDSDTGDSEPDGELVKEAMKHVKLAQEHRKRRDMDGVRGNLNQTLVLLSRHLDTDGEVQ